MIQCKWRVLCDAPNTHTVLHFDRTMKSDWHPVFFFLCLSRILWKKNEVADYEATTFSIFYNNTLFLVLVIVASFFLLKNFNPTVYPFNHTVYVICTNNIWDGSFTHTVLLWLYMASVLKCLERSLLLWYTWVIWAHKFRLHSEGRCGWMHLTSSHFNLCQCLYFSLTPFFPVTTFCPSVPPQDSSLCCPQAPSKGGKKEGGKDRGLKGWDRVGSGLKMGIRYFVFHLS